MNKQELIFETLGDLRADVRKLDAKCEKLKRKFKQNESQVSDNNRGAANNAQDARSLLMCPNVLPPLPGLAQLSEPLLIRACDKAARSIPGFAAGYPSFHELAQYQTSQMQVGIWLFRDESVSRVQSNINSMNYAEELLYPSTSLFDSCLSASQSASRSGDIGGFFVFPDPQTQENVVFKTGNIIQLGRRVKFSSLREFTNAFNVDKSKQCLIPNGSVENPAVLSIPASENAIFRWIPINSLINIANELVNEYSTVPPFNMGMIPAPPSKEVTYNSQQPIYLPVRSANDAPTSLIPQAFTLDVGETLAPFRGILSRNLKFMLIFCPFDFTLRVYENFDDSTSAFVLWKTTSLESAKNCSDIWHLLRVVNSQGSLQIIRLDTNQVVSQLLIPKCFSNCTISVSNSGMLQVNDCATSNSMQLPTIPPIASFSRLSHHSPYLPQALQCQNILVLNAFESLSASDATELGGMFNCPPLISEQLTTHRGYLQDTAVNIITLSLHGVLNRTSWENLLKVLCYVPDFSLLLTVPLSVSLITLNDKITKLLIHVFGNDFLATRTRLVITRCLLDEKARKLQMAQNLKFSTPLFLHEDERNSYSLLLSETIRSNAQRRIRINNQLDSRDAILKNNFGSFPDLQEMCKQLSNP